MDNIQFPADTSSNSLYAIAQAGFENELNRFINDINFLNPEKGEVYINTPINRKVSSEEDALAKELENILNPDISSNENIDCVSTNVPTVKEPKTNEMFESNAFTQKYPKRTQSNRVKTKIPQQVRDVMKTRLERRRERNRIAAKKSRERRANLLTKMEAELADTRHELAVLRLKYQEVCQKIAQKYRQKDNLSWEGLEKFDINFFPNECGEFLSDAGTINPYQGNENEFF